MAERSFDSLRRRLARNPLALALYQRLRPPPEARITRYLREGEALLRRYGLTEVTVTAEGGYFRSPWGAEFVYVPEWGAYGAERGTLHEAAELAHCAATVPAGTVVLDVGANLGTFSLNLAVRRPDLSFHGFEPVGATFGHLVANVRRNELESRVGVHRLALADREGELRITSSRHTDNHLVAGDGGGVATEAVPATTLDRFVEREGIEGVALLKIDAEGAEPLVLAGAERLLAEARPDLFLEVENRHLERAGTSAAGLEAWLAERGYRPATPAGFLPNNRYYTAVARG